MSTFKVTMTYINGVTKVIDDVAEGQSLMEAARSHGVEGIMGDCSGSCACATCHVYVDPVWWDKVGAPDDVEAEMLDLAFAAKDNSRLSCQIRMRAELDGLELTVAPLS